MANDLDAHAKPPAKLREVYKEYQKLKPAALTNRPDLIQFDEDTSPSNDQVLVAKGTQLPQELRQIFLDFLSERPEHLEDIMPVRLDQSPIYQVPNLPGLLIYPSLLQPQLQLSLLDRLLHRDISNTAHKTNVHLHHHVPYPEASGTGVPGLRASYFAPTSSDLLFTPKDPALHKPLTTSQFLQKKLRWCTLGGQYDWTAKQYPSDAPPPFPPDLKDLIERIFPMKAEAAILNLYSPGDTLSLHRDVSEECAAPLVSISLGCDAVFICGLERADGEAEVAVMRLRSGDAVLMSGESRYAWHGVPKIVEGTCLKEMEEWPGEEFDEWRGWMRGKRLNLNVRQMFA
ncbi:hypothetical protein M409DRAFT_27303 [Zasmidium cellare ATCC 36951]|uniref:mRNA N(6)-methyladenine demethylase n=1 Tax=Zasmidium cellare ATCC 36951 TaxID=1080233 RepID=A0A6A6C9G0_ZASCE|nr:uncharacterized protein M409DRAFT_27303 [Zasmidium cellare ATCC 36951]KAF2162299.1 hypothetical protein M409DRAFT_27303 [Zasmidium cellare ATCC 36951]